MKLKVAIKGSSESGNYGHAGRPGIVGGSAAGGKVAIATYEWLKDQPAFSWKPKDAREEMLKPGLLEMADGASLPQSHYDKLNGVLPIRNVDAQTTWLGEYNSNAKLINMHPITAEYALSSDPDNAILAERVFTHEMGHHVGETVFPFIEKVAGNVHDYIYNKVLNRGLTNELSWSSLRNIGLRAYSMSNPFELIADTYSVWRYATRDVVGRLGNLWKMIGFPKFDYMQGLDDMFGNMPWQRLESHSQTAGMYYGPDQEF